MNYLKIIFVGALMSIKPTLMYISPSDALPPGPFLESSQCLIIMFIWIGVLIACAVTYLKTEGELK